MSDLDVVSMKEKEKKELEEDLDARGQCVEEEDVICMCKLMERAKEGKIPKAPMYYYALNGVKSLTRVVCAIPYWRKHNLKRAIFCHSFRLNSEFTFRDVLPYFTFVWTNKRKGMVPEEFEGLWNHFPSESALTQKHNLARHLREYTRAHPSAENVHPLTWDLGDTNQFLAWKKLFETEERPIFIVKPVNSSSGKGIHVVETFETIKEHYPEFSRTLGLDQHLVQRYIRNPMLIENGYKFNVRTYLFIASLSPPIAYFHTGYVTQAIVPYDLSNTTNRMGHVSSTALQKTHPDFEKKRESQKWSWERFVGEMVAQGRFGSTEEFVEKVEKEMIRKVAHTVKAVLPTLLNGYRKGQFAYYGVDFLANDENEFFLIEVNKAPSATSSHNKEKNLVLIPSLINEMVSIVYEIEEKRRTGESLEVIESVSLFKPVPL